MRGLAPRCRAVRTVVLQHEVVGVGPVVRDVARAACSPSRRGRTPGVGSPPHVGAVLVLHASRTAAMNPSIAPPLMSVTDASSRAVRRGWRRRDRGTACCSVPARGIGHAHGRACRRRRPGCRRHPGYMPKYSSNERFSCTMNTACLILFMSACGRVGAEHRLHRRVRRRRLRAAPAGCRDNGRDEPDQGPPPDDGSQPRSLHARPTLQAGSRSCPRAARPHSHGGLMNGDVRCPSCGHELSMWHPPDPPRSERYAMHIADRVASWWFAGGGAVPARGMGRLERRRETVRRRIR